MDLAIQHLLVSCSHIRRLDDLCVLNEALQGGQCAREDSFPVLIQRLSDISCVHLSNLSDKMVIEQISEAILALEILIFLKNTSSNSSLQRLFTPDLLLSWIYSIQEIQSRKMKAREERATLNASTLEMLLVHALVLCIGPYTSVLTEKLWDLVIIAKSILFREKEILLQSYALQLLTVLAKDPGIKKLLWSNSYCSHLFPRTALSPIFPFSVSISPRTLQTSSESLYQLIYNEDVDLHIFQGYCEMLEALISSSKMVLSQADDSIFDFLYIGFSQQLGIAIYQLHYGILHSLRRFITSTPHNISKAKYLVHVLLVLIQNCDYGKLVEDYVSAVFDVLHLYLVTATPLDLTCSIMTCMRDLFYASCPCDKLMTKLKSREGIFVVQIFLTTLKEPFTTWSCVHIEILMTLHNIIKTYGPSALQEALITDLFFLFLNRCESYFFDVSKKHLDAIFLLCSSIICSGAVTAQLPEYCGKFIKFLSSAYPVLIQRNIMRLYARTGSILCPLLAISELKELFSFLLCRAGKGIHSLQLSAFDALITLALCRSIVTKTAIYKILCVFVKVLEGRGSVTSNQQTIFLSGKLCDFLPSLSIFGDNCTLQVNEELGKLYVVLSNLLTAKLPMKLNAIRALGRLGKFAPLSFLFSGSPCYIQSLLETMISQFGFEQHVKVQWNVCAAIGVVLENASPFLYQVQSQDVIERALFCLANLTWNCANFKIRIHATKSLCSPSRICLFGSSLPKIFDSLRIAQENVNSTPPTDNVTFRNQQQLIVELHQTISYLCDLSNTQPDNLSSS